MKKFSLILLAVLLMSLVSIAHADVAGSLDPDVVVGTLHDASMHNLSVYTNDGRVVGVYMTDDTEVSSDGLLLGDRIVINYSSMATDGSLMADKVTTLNSFVGKVTDATMHNVTVASDSETYNFQETDDTQVVATRGVTIGAPIEIAYEGELDTSKKDQTVKIWEIFIGTQVSGTIESIDTDTLTVSVGHSSYSFDISNITVSGDAHATKGENVTVKFYGKLDDNIDPQCVNIAEVDAQPAPTPTPEPPQKHHLTGTVTDVSKHSFTVKTAKHNFYTFEKRKDTHLKGTTGIHEKDEIRVDFLGELNSKKDVQPVKVTVVTLEDRPSPEPEHHTEEMILGICKDATMHTITVKANKTKYTFEIDDKTDTSMANGLLNGKSYRIYYTGKLHHTKKVQPVHVTRIVEYDQ